VDGVVKMGNKNQVIHQKTEGYLGFCFDVGENGQFEDKIIEKCSDILENLQTSFVPCRIELQLGVTPKDYFSVDGYGFNFSQDVFALKINSVYPSDPHVSGWNYDDSEDFFSPEIFVHWVKQKLKIFSQNNKGCISSYGYKIEDFYFSIKSIVIPISVPVIKSENVIQSEKITLSSKSSYKEIPVEKIDNVYVIKQIDSINNPIKVFLEIGVDIYFSIEIRWSIFLDENHPESLILLNNLEMIANSFHVRDLKSSLYDTVFSEESFAGLMGKF
jgi:hypothetical protein